jgi:predicted O-linked N-acetylglucosamine transferase (SPINDLY family)
LATLSEAFGVAMAHHAAERLHEAAALYRQILGVEPHHVGALTMLAAIGHQTGRDAEALALLDRALAADPAHAAVHYGRAVALQGLKRRAEAEAAYERAIDLKPDYVEAMNNLAGMRLNDGRANAAIELYRQVLSIRPDLADAYSNLGVALRDESRYAEAAESFRRGLSLDPDHPLLHNNLAVVLKAQGRLDDAMPLYERALALKPDYLGAHSNILMSLNYRPGLDDRAVFDAHRDWDLRHGVARAPATPVAPADRDPGRRLRVGYVSPDFRQHSVAFFFEPLLAAHDRQAVETYCYANVVRPDLTTRRLRALADHWRPVDGQEEAAIAEQIRQDRIDILVDLAGHSSGNLLTVFARKPAPIQATWLGYPNTTGLAAIDYRLTDAVADPPGAETFHCETLERLPSGFLCYRPPADAPDVGPLPALSTNAVTFGSFNNLAKLTPRVVAVWAAILHGVPKARLLLKSGGFADAEARQHFETLFAAAGIGADRLDLAPQNQGLADHLAQYRRIDLALDPFPYNGTTTTCEALWMGVPVLTLAGRRHAGRVGASLLAGLGLNGLVAPDEAGYIEAAIRLAHDLPALAALRAGLRARVAAAPLSDASGFARQVEAAYRRFWRRLVDAKRA